MRQFKTLILRALVAALCAIFALSVPVLTPEVEAASETPITETEKTEPNTYNKEDDEIALARAIVMDQAKLEAVTIVEELKVVEETQPATEASTEEVTEETQPVTEETEPATEETQAETESSKDESSSSSSTTTNSGSSSVSGVSNTGYLLDIDNPDPSYESYAIKLSEKDRDLAERIIMGEAGSAGYTGMALVAQSLRDNFVMGGYSDIATVINKHGYYGSTSITPSKTCKDVVNYIFDQGGAAVQHRVLVFYATNYCSSSWHESQEFVCQYGQVRFFDFW